MTEFETYVVKELGEIKKELFTLKGKAMAWGGMASALLVAAVELIKSLKH